MLKPPYLHKDTLRRLYEKGESLTEISETLKCPLHKVRYWMNKYKIKKRSISEAVYLKLNPDGDPFKIKAHLSREEMFLLGLGVGIYWGEGTKVDSISSLKVANSDPGILRAFIVFLRKICRLRTYRFSYSIVCFNDTRAEDARYYWSKELKVPPEKFGKITIIPTQGKGTYKRKSLYGVCTLQGNNVKLRRWVLEKIEETKTKYQNAWIAQ